MTTAQKKAFVARMAAARGKASKKTPRKAAKRNAGEMTAATERKLKSALGKLTRKAAGRGMTAADVERAQSITARLKDAGKWYSFNPSKKRSGSTKKKTVPPRRKGGKKTRRNTAGAETRAARVYEEFHGRPPAVVIDVETPIRGHSVLAGIGKLVALVIETAQGPRFEVTIEKFGGAYLCMDSKKTQLFIEGGNQSVDLKTFNITPPIHENEVLGRLVWVYYDTVKDHLGKDGGDAIYKHKFSRNGPTVIYDTRNKLLFLAGGVYDMPPEGISG